jgi:hypothetical protein
MKPVWGIFLGLCAAAAVAPPVAEREARGHGVSLCYSPADFPGHSVRREAKLTAEDNGTDIPLGVAPLRTSIVLRAPGGGEARNRIEVIPLRDASVEDFGEAYPELQDAADALRKALAQLPQVDTRLIEAGDRHTIDAEHAFRSQPAYIAGPAVEGFGFLVQYTQEEQPNPPNNEELMYVFVGLTKDRGHYVEAEFAVTHPALPRNAAGTGSIARDEALLYLRQAEKRLAGLEEGGFQPSLAHLKALVQSIAVDALPDPQKP